jgi:hypothetical protein
MASRLPILSLLFLGAFMALSCLSGCATVDQKIVLNYSPTDRLMGRHNGEITVSRIDTPSFIKNSKGEWIIGSINNVHGVHQANILSDRSLGEWITDALLLELKRAGYTVVYASVLPTGTPNGVLITDIKVSLNVDNGTFSDEAKHELKFNVDVFLNGAKVKTFTVASSNKSTFLSASKEDEEKIMLQSLQDAMQQIVPDITALIGKK